VKAFMIEVIKQQVALKPQSRLVGYVQRYPF
jgi:hypothetical protein